jgi:hypothetical protein
MFDRISISWSWMKLDFMLPRCTDKMYLLSLWTKVLIKGKGYVAYKQFILWHHKE